MCPLTHAKYLTLIVAVVASFIFGFTWYGPLFGKKWAVLVGKKTDGCCGKPPLSSMLITLLGTFLTTITMAYVINIYNPVCTIGAAFILWLGFYVPLSLSSVTWEGRPWSLFALNVVYYFLNLQLIAAILTYLR